MQPLAKLLLGLTLVCFGGLALLLNLNSLGWQRHGASLFDFSFLHLGWTLRPQLRYSSAHAFGLAAAGASLAMVIAGGIILLRLLKSHDDHRHDHRPL
jgi:hypothetical protein